jgi:hypothetical protein
VNAKFALHMGVVNAKFALGMTCDFHPLHNPSGCIIQQEPFVKGSGELLNSMS